jgi:hypothetical protein
MAALIAFSLGIFYFSQGSGFSEDEEKPNLIFWNVARGGLAQDELKKFVSEHDAKIYGFVEFPQDWNLLEIEGYEVKTFPGGMAIIARDKISVAQTKITNRYRFNRIFVGDREVCLVDILPNAFYDREPSFEKLEEFASGCDVIMGDFNTPHNSVHFDHLQRSWKSGIKGRHGNRETWPSYFPILSLDHILVAREHEMKIYQPIKIWETDHYPMTTNVIWDVLLP